LSAVAKSSHIRNTAFNPKLTTRRQIGIMLGTEEQLTHLDYPVD